MLPLASWLGVFLPAAHLYAAPARQIQFNRDIRPILSENCFVCHGHDKNQRKADLRLDVRDVAIERGAIVPGKPADSKLVAHIFADDPDDLMPPPKTRKTLSGAQKALLKDWIAAGAVYEPHWAYIKPSRHDAPRTKDRRWVRNPIDAFVLQSLEARNIRPSPEANKRTLLRRLSLDLIGLPPTPEEVKAFLADRRPGAYERQVDRLLASPHFGERMAVPWLDIVRYADTVGYHGDQNQNIFPYRDYVIEAFNRNKPFDQFTIEQLAGDLLPNGSVEARVATGFNRLNMMTREGGAQPKEYLAKYAADRARTISMAWLGSTMGCAECHDHKYDPFTSKDFYQTEAFFADVTQWGVYADYAYTPVPELKGYANDHPFPPEMEVDSPYLQHRIARLNQKLDAVHAAAGLKLQADAKSSAGFEAWLSSSREFIRTWPEGWAVFSPAVTLRFKDTNTVAATNFTVAADGTISFSERPKEDATVTLPLSNMWVAAIRLEIVPQEVKQEKAERKRRNGTAVAVTASLHSDGKDQRLPFYFGEADHEEPRYSMSLPIIGVTDLWQISTEHDRQTAVWLLDKPLQVRAGERLVVDLGSASVASARVSITPFAAGEPLKAGLDASGRTALGSPDGGLSGARRQSLERTFLLSTQWDPQAVTEARKLETEIRECRGGRAFTMVAVARKEPLPTRVLPRGNWQNESGELLEPATPHFLPQLPHPAHQRLTRLDLARWLVWGENPLTARATVNRLWKQFFGTGISAVVDDLGGQGEWPVLPELLDWLACEFEHPEACDDGRPIGKRRAGTPVPHDWDLKHLVRLMVTSATYRQDSNQRPDLKEIDPNNRLLACQTPRRLEAEFVRDNALFIAGLLDEDIGGPSAHPYQPAGYYANIQFPDRDYYPEKDERQYRRGVYTHWQRTFLHPMFANFDAPSREECTANRIVSDTPQQALTLLNDPTFVEAARVFAQRLLSTPAEADSRRLDLAFEDALARPIKEDEKRSLLNFLSAQREQVRTDTAAAQKLAHAGVAPAPAILDAGELAAWTQVCRVILNLHETITKY